MSELYKPVVESTRGENKGEPIVDGVHFGAIAVVEPGGGVKATWGSPEAVVHLRSTAKPFQLLPLLLDGIHRSPLDRKVSFGRRSRKTYQITQADLAVMMASHSGQPMHTGRVRRLLEFGGLEEAQLMCGIHPPVHVPSAETLVMANQKPTALHCNCSGKHTGMLLVCVHKELSTADYLSPEHPLQTRILRLVSGLSGVDAEDIGHAVDGCTAPTFVMPLKGLAALFAHLGAPDLAPEVEPGVRAGLAELFDAGTAHPEMIGGTHRLDTAVMEALPGAIFAKIGAMGAYGIAIAPCEQYPKGLGVALKVADGDKGDRVRGVVVPEILVQLGLLRRDHGHEALGAVSASETLNNRGFVVGGLRPCFDLTS